MKINLIEKIPNEFIERVQNFMRLKPVPLGRLAESLNIKVKLSNLDSGESGLIEKTENGFQIKINRFESRERQRFTLAHEISHFLLHKNLIEENGSLKDNVLYRTNKTSVIEREANKFAAELIVPIESFKNDIAQFEDPTSDEVIEILADEWQVSKSVISFKIAKLQSQVVKNEH